MYTLVCNAYLVVLLTPSTLKSAQTISLNFHGHHHNLFTVSKYKHRVTSLRTSCSLIGLLPYFYEFFSTHNWHTPHNFHNTE